MAKNNNTADQATPSLGFEAMVPIWSKINHILGGTNGMRLAGQKHLPRHALEGLQDYRRRLLASVFTNYYRLTLDYLVGKPFSRQVEWAESTPGSIREFESDIDLQGNDITQVFKSWFHNAMAKGFSHCMVDYPVSPSREMTGEQRDKLNLRPYLVLIQPEDFFAGREELINGRMQYTHVRIMGYETVVEGYEESLSPYIQEFNLVLDGNTRVVERKRWVPDSFNPKKWELEGEILTMDIDRIPIITFYTNKTGTLTGDLELEDLADLNIKHWQSTSDQDNCLQVARFPILAASGVPDDMVAKIGPRTILLSSDATAKYYYVEHTGAALEVGSKDIQSLEEKMAYYGAEMLKARPDRETATSRILDSSQTLAPLQRIALNFQSAAQEVIKLMAEWMDEPTEGIGVEIYIDFGMTEREEVQLKTLETGRAAKDISHEQYISGLTELRVLPSTFNATANSAQRLAETKELLKALETPTPNQDNSNDA